MRDAIVIGGGFYGVAIAAYLRQRRNLAHVTIIEREPSLMKRASCVNQSRIHSGYHYPRSISTGLRSRVNVPRFVRDYPHVVRRNFCKLYAIARRNSMVTARQFERFCRAIGATLQPAPRKLAGLFEPRLIESVYVVEEYAFDSNALAEWAREAVGSLGIDVRCGERATGARASDDRSLVVECEGAAGDKSELAARYLFNCAYSGINQLHGDMSATSARLKHEITELAVVEVPKVLESLGITVMDGPFFSIMPLPSRGLHTLSHVRYTPHLGWQDAPGVDPYAQLARYGGGSRIDRMRRDVARYLPDVRQARYVESLFEVKTVLAANEADDGRPILFQRHPGLPNAFSILGGKIDNIYDVFERLDAESLPSA